MRDNYKDPKFLKWLNKLQQESWQLELIISGFSIFGLLSVFSPLEETLIEVQNNGNPYMVFLWVIVLISCTILTFNLIFHVVLRGLWIGALGLRYVSGEIDYDGLKYSAKFTSYLKRKIGSFDKYIARLEDYCSILFALTFLMVFYFISICLMFLFVSLLFYFINKLELIWPVGRKILALSLMVIVFISSALLLIDFIGQGILKKRKWTSKLYFPIYWLSNYVGLSFLYRPLVYNFLDNKFGSRMMLFLIPLYFILITITSVYYEEANYFSSREQTSDTFANSNTYDDLINDDDYVVIASISSKVITSNYMKVFIDFKEGIDDIIFSFNKELVPENERRGLNTNIITANRDSRLDKTWRDSISQAYLKTFNEVYHIHIDSVQYDKAFILTHNKQKQLGFETYIKIDSLKEGMHILNIDRLESPKKDSLRKVISIPFWYYKK